MSPAGRELDETSLHSHRNPLMSLRRVDVHMIEEYAGTTATLTLRERIDGVSGL